MRALILLLTALFLVACGREPKPQALPPGSLVLAFGDSVTHGTGAAPGEDYPTRLAALTGWRITNAGVPGDTAENARQRIAGALDEPRHALVILEIGGNDFLRRRPESAVKEDIRALIAAARSSGARVLLVGVPRFSVIGAAVGQLSDAPLYAELSREEKIPLADQVFSDVLSDPALRADAVHPNAAGYQRLAEGLAKALRDKGLLAQ